MREDPGSRLPHERQETPASIPVPVSVIEDEGDAHLKLTIGLTSRTSQLNNQLCRYRLSRELYVFPAVTCSSRDRRRVLIFNCVMFTIISINSRACRESSSLALYHHNKSDRTAALDVIACILSMAVLRIGEDVERCLLASYNLTAGMLSRNMRLLSAAWMIRVLLCQWTFLLTLLH